MKCRGDFFSAWGGIASLELSLSAVWTAIAQLKPSRYENVARWLSEAPAKLAGFHRKGRIAEGCDADLVVWDPDAERAIDPSALQQRHKLTPYAGCRLRGVVRATFLRGTQVWDDDRIGASTAGQLL
jgi:allantoinase